MDVIGTYCIGNNQFEMVDREYSIVGTSTLK